MKLINMARSLEKQPPQETVTDSPRISEEEESGNDYESLEEPPTHEELAQAASEVIEEIDPKLVAQGEETVILGQVANKIGKDKKIRGRVGKTLALAALSAVLSFLPKSARGAETAHPPLGGDNASMERFLGSLASADALSKKILQEYDMQLKVLLGKKGIKKAEAFQFYTSETAFGGDITIANAVVVGKDQVLMLKKVGETSDDATDKLFEVDGKIFSESFPRATKTNLKRLETSIQDGGDSNQGKLLRNIGKLLEDNIAFKEMLATAAQKNGLDGDFMAQIKLEASSFLGGDILKVTLMDSKGKTWQVSFANSLSEAGTIANCFISDMADKVK